MKTIYKHSGNLGDIIYSIPYIRMMNRGDLIIIGNVPAQYCGIHPLGNVMFNKNMFNILLPLLESQNLFDDIRYYDISEINSINTTNCKIVDLDIFRDGRLNLGNGCIQRWLAPHLNVFPDLSEQYIFNIPIDNKYKNSIVINRTFRYRSSIDFSFLNNHNDLIFIGIQEEYNDFKKYAKNIEFIETKTFLDVATIINSCKLFIGNASSAYSIADGLKHKRILEAARDVNNVIPMGRYSFEIRFQQQAINLIENLINE